MAIKIKLQKKNTNTIFVDQITQNQSELNVGQRLMIEERFNTDDSNVEQ